MKTIFIAVVSVAILLGVGGVWLHAEQAPSKAQSTQPTNPLQQPTQTPSVASTASETQPPVTAAINAPVIGPVSSTPTVVTINMPTPVIITAQITDSTLIPNSVNVLRLGASGTTPTVIGTMHDDGQNGDAVAGDHIYTLQTTFTEQASGQIQLQISAAFRGVLRRLTAALPSIPISPAQTFVSTSTGITLNYPADWSNITQTTYSIILGNVATPSPLGISFFQVHYMPQANAGLLSISEWFTDFSAQLPSPPGSVSTTSVNGYSAVQLAGGDIIPETVYYVSKGPDIYEISYISGDSFMTEYSAILKSLTF